VSLHSLLFETFIHNACISFRHTFRRPGWRHCRAIPAHLLHTPISEERHYRPQYHTDMVGQYSLCKHTRWQGRAEAHTGSRRRVLRSTARPLLSVVRSLVIIVDRPQRFGVAGGSGRRAGMWPRRVQDGKDEIEYIFRMGSFRSLLLTLASPLIV